MMRAIGFLSGVCLTVAALVLLLDSRDSPPPDTVTAAPATPTPAELSRMVAAIAEQVDLGQAELAPDPADPRSPETGAADGDVHDNFDAAAPDPVQPLDDQAQAHAAAAKREEPDVPGTFLFWSQFRSESAAQGFARRLSAATQVPVEVVAAGPGNYRVAFSYVDETQRLAQINRIETITGLQLE